MVADRLSEWQRLLDSVAAAELHLSHHIELEERQKVDTAQETLSKQLTGLQLDRTMFISLLLESLTSTSSSSSNGVSLSNAKLTCQNQIQDQNQDQDQEYRHSYQYNPVCLSVCLFNAHMPAAHLKGP